MKRLNLNHIWIGAVIGLLLPLLGAAAIYWFRFRVFSLSDILHASVLVNFFKIGVLLNLIPFFLFIWRDKEKASQGVLLSTFLYGFYIAVQMFL